MNGRENTANSSPDAGTAKTDGDWFLSDSTGSFLRLTESKPHQRTTALYAGTMFRADQDFAIRMDLRISGNKNNADGISFFWLDAKSVADIGTTIGGSGQWMGTPRGDVTGTPGSENSTSSYGWYAGLKGYALGFDHYSNDPVEPPEYTAVVNLSDWTYVIGTITDFSSDPNFYIANGWQTVQFAYDSAGNNYTLSWGYNGSSFTKSRAYSAAGTAKFASAYFGFGGGTDGLNSDQDVRNIALSGTAAGSGPAAVPELSTAFGAAILVGIGLLSVAWRKGARKRSAKRKPLL